MPILNLLVLRVTSIDAAEGFYTALGLSFVHEQHEAGPRHLSCMAGETLLELYPTEDGLTTQSTRLGFNVRSLDTAVDAVVKVGGTLISKPKQGTWGRRAVVSDPDGHKVELLERGL